MNGLATILLMTTLASPFGSGLRNGPSGVDLVERRLPERHEHPAGYRLLLTGRGIFDRVVRADELFDGSGHGANETPTHDEQGVAVVLGDHFLHEEVDRTQLRSGDSSGVPLDSDVRGEHFGGVSEGLVRNHDCVLGMCIATILYGREDETAERFVKRIAPRLAYYTRETGVEVCGRLQLINDKYTLKLYRGKPTSCALPAGEGQTVHTHPDASLRGFSDADFCEPGYLVLKFTVLYQNGKGTERQVASFNSLSRQSLARSSPDSWLP